MKRPIIIAIEGNIGTGKSTLLHNLEITTDSKIITCAEPIDEWLKIKNGEGETILKKFYDDPKKYSFSFQILILKTLNELMSRLIHDNPECEIILCERSILSSHYVFTKMLHHDGLMDEIEYQLYKDIFRGWCIDEIIPDKIIYLQASPEKCLDRIKKRQREGEEHISLEYLQKCNDYYDEFLTSHIQDIPLLVMNVEEDTETNGNWKTSLLTMFHSTSH